MNCGCENEKKEAQGKGFPKAVVEITNPENIVLFRRVVIPATMGDETDVLAAVGKYRNVILEYEASGSVYVYSSDGVPTKLTLNIDELEERLNTRVDQEVAEEVEAGLASKQDVLIEGDNITIENNVISAESTTYSDFVGATGAEAGEAGLVPAPAATDNTKFLKGDGTWATVSSGSTYSAGEGIDITNDEISVDTTVIATVESVEEVSSLSGNTSPSISTVGTLGQTYVNETTGDLYYLSQITEIEGEDDQYTWTKLATGGDVNDATITITNNGTAVDSFTVNAATNKTIALSSPEVTMTTTDPGEGSNLSDNHFVAVYGGDPIILDYSTTEINTGAKWIDGSAIYKKTVNFGALPNSTTKTVAHGIPNLGQLVDIRAIARNTDGTTHAINGVYGSASSTEASNLLYENCFISFDGNITISTNSDRSAFSAYITLYYTKSS